jgi:type II secretory pathway pseudopilin PulG
VKKHAFTLIELLIVATIIMFLCVIGIPTITTDNEYFLQQELEKITIVIHSLQQTAIVSQIPQTIAIEPAANHYSFIKNAQKVAFSLHPALSFGFLPTYGPPADPVGPITHIATFPEEKGVFYIKILSNGKISPGAVYIVDKQQKSMGALTCGVSQVSYIRRYVYKTNQWQLLTN